MQSAIPAEELLIVEDDIPAAQSVRSRLEGSYLVDVVHDPESALHALLHHQYHLLIMDLNFQEPGGPAVLQQIRCAKPDQFVLALIRGSHLEDRISALDGGADDCLTNPFSFQELNARVRALLRRCGNTSIGTRQIGDLFLSRVEARVERGGRQLQLTQKEFALLEYLMINAGRPVSRSQIMENAWNSPYDPKSNLVDVYIKYVRDKVDSDSATKLIRTVRRVGYTLAPN